MNRLTIASLAFSAVLLLSVGTPTYAATSDCNAPTSPYTNCACFGPSDCNTAAGYSCDASIDTCTKASATTNPTNPTNTTANPATGGTPSGLNLAPLTSYKTGILSFINDIAVPILIAVAFLVFLWGVAKAYIIKGASDTAREEGHQIILWGVIGFVVVFALWGIVNLALSIFGLTAGGSASGANLKPPQL